MIKTMDKCKPLIVFFFLSIDTPDVWTPQNKKLLHVRHPERMPTCSYQVPKSNQQKNCLWRRWEENSPRHDAFRLFNASKESGWLCNRMLIFPGVATCLFVQNSTCNGQKHEHPMSGKKRSAKCAWTFTHSWKCYHHKALQCQKSHCYCRWGK